MRTLIVGAGAAGAVIARRLVDDDRHEVVLVEAGPDYPAAAQDIAQLPADLRDGRQNSMRAHDWGYGYRATDHKLFSSMHMDFPRGRVVGGSSAVNTCIALRGQPYDYDEWASLGLPEWSFDACLPAFKRLETDLDFDNEWHGQSGPIPVRRHTDAELTRWQAAFLEACHELGYPKADDTNDPTSTGAGKHAMNKVNGERMGAARCYLDARTRARRNLHIVPHTLVRRVLFHNQRVQGLELERFGRVFTLTGDRVVLCAGAVSSPGILLRSGIGPSASVLRVGAQQIYESPGVAARLLDHPGLAVFFKPLSSDLCSLEHPLIQTVCRYTSNKSACPNDMQLQPGSFVPLPGLPLRIVTLATCIGKPVGQGRIVFRSSRPSDAPLIETQFLRDEADRTTAREALAHLGRLAGTKAISALARPVYPRKHPWNDAGEFTGPLEQITGSGYHPSGTAPMGPDTDPLAVTDGRGRVRGVSGLFVADASLMPTIPSSNTHLPTLMIGERMAEWLRDT
jgi:choline dehydrogenase